MNSKPNSDALGPLEIVSKGNWERALFTTYALSLTFFETHILKAGLLPNGCHTIWVVADIDGYQQTLAERQSSRVGLEYHLVPVALSKGIFHPKCVYLSGPEGDILLVGSGNLTFGGFGRNVEVLEVLTSAECPWVFRAFGDYLNALNSRTDFINPDRRWIEVFSDLAKNAGKGDPDAPAPGPLLLHSVERSIGDQLEDHFIAAGGASRLRFLSPFYDPDATAVREVTAAAECQCVTIGLLRGQEDQSAFPFDARLTSGVRLEAAVVSTERENRRLHAKWLEADLNDGRRLVLTGSVNATKKSLCSTDNIEVGMLRILPNRTTRHLNWERTELPTRYERHDFRAAGLGNRWVIHARFTNEAVLAGVVMGAAAPGGEWAAFLARPDGERVEFTARVLADGSFRVPVPHAEHFATATAVQITLRRGVEQAVGWLHLENILNLPRLHRLGLTSLMRLVNDEQTEDDDAALLEYLALSAQNHLRTFRMEVKSCHQDEAQGPRDGGDLGITVDLDRLVDCNIGI